MIINSIKSVMSLVIMIAVGAVITKKPWFGKTGEDFLSKLCVQVAIPLYMIANVYETCKNRKEMLEMLRYFPIPFFIITFFLLMGVVVAGLLKVDRRRRGAFVNVMGFSNTVFIGFPIVISILGEEALPTAMSYYIANTALFWTVGAWFLRKDHDPDAPVFTKENIKKIFSMPIIGFLVGTAVVMMNIKIPGWIFNPISQIGKMATPIGMLVIGSILRTTDYKNIKMSKDVAVLLVNRFLLSPVIMFAVMLLLPLDDIVKQVYLILIIMPAMTQFGIQAKESGADYEFCTVLIAVTTLVSILVIPVYTMILEGVF